MSFRIVCLIGFIGASLGSIAFADDSTDRAKLAGTWESNGAVKAVWILESQGDGFHITNSQGDKKVVEFVCSLGKECEVKDAGRKVKVTLFFNGPKLVVLETRGDEVVKKRFGAVETGDTLELEVIPVAPDGKTETVHFKRVPNAPAVAAAK
ncbi:MAG TPA: hypothetical protein VGG72_04580 [Bryobacteraceae bacterium]|jgi:hypothetical protein